MISSELPEVLGMSDRVMVMHEGHVTGFLDRAEADQVKIMELAARSSCRIREERRMATQHRRPRRWPRQPAKRTARCRRKSASSWC